MSYYLNFNYLKAAVYDGTNYDGFLKLPETDNVVFGYDLGTSIHASSPIYSISFR